MLLGFLLFHLFAIIGIVNSGSLKSITTTNKKKKKPISGVSKRMNHSTLTKGLIFDSLLFIHGTKIKVYPEESLDGMRLSQGDDQNHSETEEFFAITSSKPSIETIEIDHLTRFLSFFQISKDNIGLILHYYDHNNIPSPSSSKPQIPKEMRHDPFLIEIFTTLLSVLPEPLITIIGNYHHDDPVISEYLDRITNKEKSSKRRLYLTCIVPISFLIY